MFTALLAVNILLLPLSPAFATDPVANDADDPAFWLNRSNPAQSRIIATDKFEKEGGLYVFDMDGKTVQKISGLNRPNNVDVSQIRLGKEDAIDIAVVTERENSRLLIYKINPVNGMLSDITGNTPVVNSKGEALKPMGIALAFTGTRTWAVVSPKEGPARGYLKGMVLTYNQETQKVDATLRAEFGEFSAKKEIESIAILPRGKGRFLVFYSDETVANRTASLTLKDDSWSFYDSPSVFNTQGVTGDHEGIAFYKNQNRQFVVCTDQIQGGSVYNVHLVEKGFPKVAQLTKGADDTDGIEIIPAGLVPKFPNGALIAMNSKDKNYLVYDLGFLKNLK